MSPGIGIRTGRALSGPGFSRPRHRDGRRPAFVFARGGPELASDLDGIDAGGAPPGSFVTGAMGGTVMDAAERHREFIAGLAAECAWLHVAQVMGVRWLAAADEAGLPHNKAQVLPIAIAPRGSNGERALVDAAVVAPLDDFSPN